MQARKRHAQPTQPHQRIIRHIGLPQMLRHKRGPAGQQARAFEVSGAGDRKCFRRDGCACAIASSNPSQDSDSKLNCLSILRVPLNLVRANIRCGGLRLGSPIVVHIPGRLGMLTVPPEVSTGVMHRIGDDKMIMEASMPHLLWSGSTALIRKRAA